MNVAKEDKNDVLTEIFSSKAILLGSPTINYGYSHAVAGLLEMMKGLRFKKKKLRHLAAMAGAETRQSSWMKN